MPTLGEVVEEVMERAPRDASGRLQQDPNLVAGWVSSRYMLALQRWPWSFLQADSSITTVANTRSYALASDFWRPWYFRNVTTGRRMLRKPVGWMDTVDPASSHTGPPVAWDLWAGQVVFWPTPDGAYTVAYRYLKQPQRPSKASDTILFDNTLFLVYGALSEACSYLAGLSNQPQMFEAARNFEAQAELMLESMIEVDRTKVGLPTYQDESEDYAALGADAETTRRFDFWTP
jgi:hypothetical protein